MDFRFDSTGIICLPNYPRSNTYSSPSLTSVPLCDPFNTNGCSVYWNINGKVYNDTSGNCLKDIGETNVQNMKVNLYENGVLTQQNYSGGYGIYSFYTDTGTFETTVDTTGTPFDILCPVSRFDTSVITALDSFDYNMDFAMQCKPGFDVGVWSVVPNTSIRPGALVHLAVSAGDWAKFWGQTCHTENLSGLFQMTIGGPTTYISPEPGALTPVAAGNVLSYTIADWAAIDPLTAFNVIIQVDTSAFAGQYFCVALSVNPFIGDNNFANNVLQLCEPVVNSYDPNVKVVYPAGDWDTLLQPWFTYTVRFQNTGNATAQHIYVTDTLDTDLDACSFQLLGYSHVPMIEIKENAVRFNFPNINLPDSNANELASHGYVQYRVKMKPGLATGTHINNTAFIYFDFNAPVVTNTTNNTITNATGIKEFGMQNLEFRMNPNPTSTAVNISVDDEMIGSSLTVYDVTGRKMAGVELKTLNYKLETSAFATGVYFVTIESEKGRITKKLVVER